MSGRNGGYGGGIWLGLEETVSYEGGFVGGGGFAGTLLEGEAWGIDDAWCCSPSGQLAASELPALYLLEGEKHIDVRRRLL